MPYNSKQKQAEAGHAHYLAHKEEFRLRLKQRRRRNKKYADARRTACISCGESDKACLDFHHLGDKTRSISQLIHRGCATAALQIEIDKCEVLCANCHQKQHGPTRITDGSHWKNVSSKLVAKRKWFIAFLATQKCVTCGETNSTCLVWHHTNKKRATIYYILTSNHSLLYLQEELATCQPLCTNCHRKLHSTVTSAI